MSTPDGIFVGPNTGFVGVKTGTPTQALDVQGNAVVSGYLSASNLGTFRNRIINGDMKMDQKNAGAAVVVGESGNTAPSYSLGPDRWQVATGASSGQLVAQQVDLSAADRIATGSAFDKAVSLSAVPTNGLVAYLGFENTLADSVGLLTNPTMTGTAVYSGLARVGDRSLDLTANTVNSQAVAYCTYSTPGITLPVTIAAWINPSVMNTYQYAISIGTTTVLAYTMSIWFTSGQFYADAFGSNGTTNFQAVGTGTSGQANTWYHVCSTIVGNGNHILYVNGVQVGSTPFNSSQFPTNNIIRVGGNVNTNAATYTYKGLVDDVRIYNRALSATEVQALARYVPIMPAPTSGLTSRLEFDGALTDSVGLLTSPTMTGTAAYSTISKSGSRSLDVTANPTGGTPTTFVTYSSLSISLPVTISVWFNVNALYDYGCILHTLASSGNGVDLSFGSGGTLAWNITNVGGPSTSIAANRWYNGVCTLTSTGITFYINGVLIGYQAYAFTSITKLVIGSGNGGNAFKGLIDDVRIYNTALTPSQVAGLYYSYANTGYVLYQQPIEGHNLTDLALGTTAAQPLTVSAWVKNNSSVAQQIGLALNNNAGLVAYLPFDGAVGDTMGFIPNPLATGTIAYSSSSKVGSQCLDLTANTAGAPSGPTSVSLGYSYTNFSLPISVSLWVYSSVTNQQGMIVCFGNTSWGYTVMIGETGVPYGDLWNGSTNYSAVGTTAVPLNNWFHYCSTVSPNGSHTIYINGVFVGTRSISGVTTITDSNGNAINRMQVGSMVGGVQYPFKGLVDDLKIYNRALSASEVLAIYNANASSTTPTTAIMPRSVIYATPSIPSNSWQRVAFSVPGDTVGYWTSNVTTSCFLSACLGAASLYSTSNMATSSNNSSAVWNAIPEYTGSNVQIMGGSSNNLLALPTGSILLTGVQLEKGNVATTYEVRGPEVESLLNAVVPVGTRLTDVPVDMMNYGNLQLSGNISAGNLGMFRNRIINGDMRIDQRYGGASQTATLNVLNFPLDRFALFTTSGSLAGQRVTDAPFNTGFTNSLRITVNTATVADSWTGIMERIEGTSVLDFQWGSSNAVPVTVSFWVKCSVAGRHSFSIATMTTNNANLYYWVTTYTIQAPNTWEYKVITIPGATMGTFVINENTSLELRWYASSPRLTGNRTETWQYGFTGAYVTVDGTVDYSKTVGATFHITGVQMEKGTMATPFEFRPYGTELALCQRYFERITILTLNFVSSNANGAGTANWSSSIYYLPKRTTPSVSTWVDSPTYLVGNMYAGTPYAVTPAGISINSCRFTSTATGIHYGGVDINAEL